MSKAELIAVSSFAALTTSEGGAPMEWVQLLPMGKFAGKDGRGPYHLKDKAHAERVIKATHARAANADLVIDYDHQSDFAAVPQVGGRAPASGWIKELQARDDGIYGRVEWTATASAHLQAREYRYISPVFTHTKQGEVLLLLRAGLTNNPNLELAAVASQAHHVEEDSDDMLKEIARALGLAETATQEEVLAAINTQKTELETSQTALNAAHTALHQLGKAAGAKEGGTHDEIVTAVSSAIANGKDNGGQDALVAVQAELTALKASIAKEKAETAVNAAVKAGKIAPAAREEFLAIATEDLTRFEKIVGAMPAVITPGGDGGRPRIDPETVTLSDEDKAICRAMDISEEDFLKTKKESQL